MDNFQKAWIFFGLRDIFGGMLKRLLDLIEIELLNIELYRVHTEWRHRNVISPYTRLYYITSGQGVVTYHKSRQTYRLTPGYLYLIPCFTRVDLFCPRTFCHYYIHLTTRLPNGTDLLSTLEYAQKVKAGDFGITANIFNRLIALNPGRELHERDANKPIYKSLLDRSGELDQNMTVADHLETNGLLRLLLAPFLKDNLSTTVSNTMEGLKRFQTVLEYIQENLASPISLNELANLADLNPAYFSDLFRQLMGLSPIQYVNRRKIEQAQVLLMTSDKPLKEISRWVGFRDEFYFSRLFKQITGLAPAIYRKQALST
jgi:AraC family transcriptional regulator